jgi:hypothetical protein
MIVEGKEEFEEDDHAEWKAQLDEGERVRKILSQLPRDARVTRPSHGARR